MVAQPYVPRPLYTCSSRLLVLGCWENAFVRVYDENDVLLGESLCHYGGRSVVSLLAPLSNEVSVYATQQIDGYTSIKPLSSTPVEVYTGVLPKPRLFEPLYECSRAFRTQGIVPGADLTVVTNETSAQWQGLYSSSLTQIHFIAGNASSVQQGELGKKVAVEQVMCPNGSNIRSPQGVAAVIAAPGNTPAPKPVMLTSDGQLGFGLKEGRGLYATNLLAGATISFFDGINQAPILTRHVYRDSLDDDDRGDSFQLPNLGRVQPGWTLSAQQELCTVSKKSPGLAPLDPAIKPVVVLGVPKIFEPVCAGATWVDVRSNGNAYTLLERGSEVLTYSAYSSWSRMSIPPSYTLQVGDMLTAKNVTAQGVTGPSSDPATVVVSAGAGLNANASKSYVSQNDGSLIHDAHNMSREQGPLFDFRECCPETGPQDDSGLSVQITQLGVSSPQVVTLPLKLQQDGAYSARWDWYLALDTGTNVPIPNASYEAKVLGGCISPSPTTTFNVVIAERTPGDVDAPTTQLTASAGGATVSAAQNEYKTLMVAPGEPITATAQGKDFYGVEYVEIVATDDLSDMKSKTALEKLPLPGVLSVTSTPGALAPGQKVTFISFSRDFHGNFNQPAQIEVTALAAAPTISSLSPNPTYSNDGEGAAEELTINGEQLSFAASTTRVIFREPQTGTTRATVQSSGFNDEREDRIKLDIPAALFGLGGDLQVVVEVDGVESAPALLTLSDREGPFKHYTIANFSTVPGSSSQTGTIQCSANASDPLAIDRIEYTGAESNIFVTVYLNGNTSSGTMVQGPILGPGVLLDTTSCKALVTWGQTNINQNPQNFFRFYYSGGSSLTPTNLDNFGVDLWVVGFSKDGTLAGVVSKDMTSKGNVLDLLMSDRPLTNKDMECISNCKFTFDVKNGRKIQILEGGQVKNEETL